MTTASETSLAGDGQVTRDVLLLGAAGNSGRLIAAELAARHLSVRLAGRRRGPPEDLARELAAGGATIDVRTVEAGDAGSLAGAIDGVGVVLSTIGPFARQAGPVIDACLAARVPYVDIANEWPAVRGLLDRDEQARAPEPTPTPGPRSAGPAGIPSRPSCTPAKASAQRPPSPPKQPGAFWPEPTPAHGPRASCSVPPL